MLLTLLVGAFVEVTLLLGGAGVAGDIPGGHLAKDGEEDREAEVAAKTPPHTTLVIPEQQGVKGIRQVEGQRRGGRDGARVDQPAGGWRHGLAELP